MPLPVLYPHFDHPAIEERYASWQSQLLLREGGGPLHFYDPDAPGAEAVEEIDTPHVLVITDPLLVPPGNLADRLLHALVGSGAFGAVPVSNEATHPSQRHTGAPYLTLRELRILTDELQRRPSSFERIRWDDSNPGAFVAATHDLAPMRNPMGHALSEREVVISHNDFVHRWSSLRGQLRTDLLSRISPEARSILEFGCGEAPLGEALKQRQKCRVVGIELDRDAAAVARKRIDDVYCGDVREIVAILAERFDWIVGGDIIEHLDEPWTFLADLRRIAAPGGHLLLTIPNLAHASIVGDLLQGRFDYVYMGLTCVGHLRFFTRRSIEEMLRIAGWEIVEISPQESIVTPPQAALLQSLRTAGIPHSADDLQATGYYIVARNPA